MGLMSKKDINLVIRDNDTQLSKCLNSFDLTMLGIGAIIGTGIFVLTGTGALKAGPGLMFAFIIAALACLFAALCYAEFASMVPIAGSAYTYTYTTIGEIFAFIIGWDLALEYMLGVSTVSVGWSGYFRSFIEGFGITIPSQLTAAPGVITSDKVTGVFNLPAFLIVLIITFLIAMGIKETKRVNNIMVLIKIVVVMLFICVAIFYVKPANLSPVMPFGFSGVFAAAATVFFAFIGFDAVSSSTEETINPAKTMPRGIILSLLICTVLYVIVSLIMTGVVPFKLFGQYEDHPVSAVLKYSGQNWISGIIDIGAILGMTTVMLVMLYGQTRVTYAMSKDGLMPKFFSKVNGKTDTPFIATWLFGMVSALLGGFVSIDALSEMVNIGTLSAFILVAISIIVLRKTAPHIPRKFKCPAVPIITIFAIIFCLFLILNLDPITWLRFLVWLIIGFVVYFVYSRKHAILNH